MAIAVGAAVIVPLLPVLYCVVRILFRRLARWAFRTRFQFSLRTLLVVVTFCAVLCSGQSWWRQVQRQRESIRQECRGLDCDLNWDTAHWWSIYPTWASLTPNNYFHLNRLSDGDEITDEQLNRLRPHLRYVETLFLDGTAVTDRDLEHFEDMTELRTLGLGSTRVTDVGLSHLPKLARLEALNLGGAGGSDRTVAWYARFCKRHDLKIWLILSSVVRQSNSRVTISCLFPHLAKIGLATECCYACKRPQSPILADPPENGR